VIVDRAPPSRGPHIAVKDLTFAYPDRRTDRAAARHLDIGAGTVFGVFGRRDRKTIFAVPRGSSIAARHVFVDGTDVVDLDLRVRERMRLVPQRPSVQRTIAQTSRSTTPISGR
jgi:hypothetical protein